MRRYIAAAITVGLGCLWWFPGYDYVSHPGTYRLGILFMAVVVASGALHAAALRRFHRMARVIHDAEHRGLVTPGSALFADNQRFRYAVRVVEAVWVLGVGVLALLSVRYPTIVLHPWYGRIILTYFIGSIAATGYLTWRDLWVLRKVRAMDVKLADVRGAEVENL